MIHNYAKAGFENMLKMYEGNFSEKRVTCIKKHKT